MLHTFRIHITITSVHVCNWVCYPPTIDKLMLIPSCKSKPCVTYIKQKRKLVYTCDDPTIFYLLFFVICLHTTVYFTRKGVRVFPCTFRTVSTIHLRHTIHYACVVTVSRKRCMHTPFLCTYNLQSHRYNSKRTRT